MPAILDRCVVKVMKTGKSKSSSFAICTASLKKAHKMKENLDSLTASEIIELSMAELTTKKRNSLDDSDFAYIDKNGGKHLPIHDAVHVRNALARFNQTHFDSPDAKTKAMAKIKSRAEKFGVKVSGVEMVSDVLSDRGYQLHKAHVYPLCEIRAGENGVLPASIQILPIGEWDTVPYDKLKITAADCEEMIRNFKEGVRAGDTLPIDVDHDGKQAAGWMTDLFLQNDGLYASVEWNDLGKKLLGEKRYKFFSPEFNPEYTDPENKHLTLSNVLIAGSLVNRPLFKELKPLVASDHLTETNRGIMLFIEHMDLKELQKKKKAGETLTADEEAYLKTHKAHEGDEGDDAGDKHTPTDDCEECEECGDKMHNPDAHDHATKADEGDEADEGKDKGKGKKGSEPNVRTITAAEYDALKKMADRGVEAAEKLEAKEVEETVGAWIFSEKGGYFQPALKGDITAFYKSLDTKQRKTFGEIVSKLPEQKALFKEYGDAEDLTPGKKADILTVKANEIREKSKTEKRPLTFSEAMKIAVRENPELGASYAVPKNQILN